MGRMPLAGSPLTVENERLVKMDRVICGRGSICDGVVPSACGGIVATFSESPRFLGYPQQNSWSLNAPGPRPRRNGLKDC